MADNPVTLDDMRKIAFVKGTVTSPVGETRSFDVHLFLREYLLWERALLNSFHEFSISTAATMGITAFEPVIVTNYTMRMSLAYYVIMQYPAVYRLLVLATDDMLLKELYNINKDTHCISTAKCKEDFRYLLDEIRSALEQEKLCLSMLGGY